MDKILDIGDIFGSKLASFSVPAIAVLIFALVIFFLTRQNEKEFDNSSKLPGKTPEVVTKKKKRSIVDQPLSPTVAVKEKQKKKENKDVKLPKKESGGNKTSKIQLSNKDGKVITSKTSSEAVRERDDEGEYEWQTVTTKRQKKNVENQFLQGAQSSPKKFSVALGTPKVTEESGKEQIKVPKKNKKRALRE